MDEYIKIDKRVKEFGIDIKWASEYKIIRNINQTDDEDESDEKILLHSLLLVMGVGTIFSIVVFVLELLYFYLDFNSVKDCSSKIYIIFSIIFKNIKNHLLEVFRKS